jgi:hypothetical protein
VPVKYTDDEVQMGISCDKEEEPLVAVKAYAHVEEVQAMGISRA